MKYTSISEIGLVRHENQDFVAVCENENALLAMVCDGIGGANAGSVASRMVIELFKEAFKEKGFFNNSEDIRTWFVQTITHVNKVTYHESLVVPEYSGMGTTLVAVVVYQDAVIGFNIGDSRIYVFKNDTLTCLSHDQTYAYEMYRRKQIRKEEIALHPKRNVLMNAVGIDETIDFEIIEIDKEWDSIMLCSDGLHGYVSHEMLEKSFVVPGILSQRNHLMDLAYKAGGYDNISIILLEADTYE